MIDLNSKLLPADAVVDRTIDDEIIIIPLISGLADIEGDLFSLNNQGKSIWDKIKENKKVSEIVSELSAEYNEPEDTIKNDVIDFLTELKKKGIIKEI